MVKRLKLNWLTWGVVRYGLIPTAFFFSLLVFNYAEEVSLAEEKLSPALRIEDYLDPYDGGAFEALEEYYDNLGAEIPGLTEAVHNKEEGRFFFFYSMDEKNKSLRQRCKILVLLLFGFFLWAFADKRLRRRACSLSGI